mmetsp:Transcript_1092/g.3198  ORF Transcript_1092/g.3198 Transcript_1092/m.3198 type:complete len:224 (-) Transcript_1092:617-1288(-)
MGTGRMIESNLSFVHSSACFHGRPEEAIQNEENSMHVSHGFREDVALCLHDSRRIKVQVEIRRVDEYLPSYAFEQIGSTLHRQCGALCLRRVSAVLAVERGDDIATTWSQLQETGCHERSDLCFRLWIGHCVSESAQARTLAILETLTVSINTRPDQERSLEINEGGALEIADVGCISCEVSVEEESARIKVAAIRSGWHDRWVVWLECDDSHIGSQRWQLLR